MIVLDFIVSRSLFSTIIHIFNICELELLTGFSAIGICQVITDIERSVELQVLLGQVLDLRCDAVHVVIAHCKCVASRLAVCSRIVAGSTCQAVKCIVGVLMAHLTASSLIRQLQLTNWLR